MEIKYTSTRDKNVIVSPSKAIVTGLSHEGGLFVPTSFPKLDKSLDELSKMDYKNVAYEVMKLFLTDFTESELRGCIEKAYDDKFDTDEIVPLSEVDNAYYVELFHGATIAFKDMALSILPHLMMVAAKKNNINDKICILTATSGDTGKAALAGFAGVDGTKIVVFYPKNGVSAIQERQMVTQKGDNVKVVGIKGNFDDAQTGVKNIFGSDEMAKLAKDNGTVFSSANSINIGRLVPQIAYYVFSYVTLIKEGRINAGDKVNFVVPTGNFGNILAGFYAKEIGIPVNKLICASNENKVLYDFFKTGTYDRNREFILTTSPSMDILISSNLERLIYYIAGNDSDKCLKLMNELKTRGSYTIDDNMKAKLDTFVGGFASEDEVSERIRELYTNDSYVIDTHTAVASSVYKAYRENTKDETVSLIISTASPYKFPRAVLKAIEGKDREDSDFELIDILNNVSHVAVPKAVTDVINSPVRFDIVCDTDKMKDEVLQFL